MASDAIPVERPPYQVIAAVLLGLLVAAGGVFWYLERQASEARQTTLTAEGKAYASRLKLSEVTMQATENMMRQAVVEVLGKVTNTGDRNVRFAALDCVFMDPRGRPIDRERATLIPSTGNGLAPGQTKQFRLAFDAVPDTWNQSLPQFVIAQVRF